MLEVLTLLSGLLIGHQNVELAVADTVARVEIRLDDVEVAVLDGPPWQAMVDFGQAPAPQRLELVARNAVGDEMARLRRGVNGATDTPRAITPLRVVFEGEIPSLETMDGWFAVEGEPLEVRGMGGGPPRLTVIPTPSAHRRLVELADPEGERPRLEDPLGALVHHGEVIPRKRERDRPRLPDRDANLRERLEPLVCAGESS